MIIKWLKNLREEQMYIVRSYIVKVGKTTRPFRCDLNQTPYNYTVEVTNRFKRLDLIDREPEDLWTEFCSIMQ